MPYLMMLGSAQDWIATTTRDPAATLYLIQVSAGIQAMKTQTSLPKCIIPTETLRVTHDPIKVLIFSTGITCWHWGA